MATVLFIASLAIVPFIPSTFIPPGDKGLSNLSVELAPGTYDVRATDNNSAGRHYVSLWPGEMRFLIAYVRAGGAVDVGQVSKEEGRDYVLGGQRARASE